mgnify:FL=1
MARLENDQGGAVYFNPILKHGKEAWVIKGIGDTVIIGRDRQRKKSRIFTQYAQTEAYLRRHGFNRATY